MIRILGCLLIIGLVVTSLDAAGDPVPDQPEPPVRLKKKVKPQPELLANPRPEAPRKEEPKPKETERPRAEEPKDDAEPNAQDLQERIRETTNRISKHISQVEERLRKKDSGEATQQAQRDIVRDLDELIQQTKLRQQQQQQQQGSGSSRSSNPSTQQASRQRTQQTRTASNPSRGQPESQSGNNPPGSKRGQEGMSKLADLYKDVWGHLPETLRQEMDQYSREQFMAKYADLLKQYYATIAEKGRRKQEP